MIVNMVLKQFQVLKPNKTEAKYTKIAARCFTNIDKIQFWMRLD